MAVTLSEDSIHTFDSIMSMEEFLCILKCPEGGEEHAEAVSISCKGLGSIVIE